MRRVAKTLPPPARESAVRPVEPHVFAFVPFHHHDWIMYGASRGIGRAIRRTGGYCMIEGDQLPVIAAGRVRLRPLTIADVEALFGVFSDPQVMRYWSRPPMRDLAEARALLGDIHSSFQERSLFQWGVALAGDDRVVGTCTLFHLDAPNRRAEVGYALARDCWGQGLMSEALTALIDYAFGPLGLWRLEADVDPRNQPSIRIVERLGFVREGLLRERWHVDGETQDSLFLGLLRRDWLARPTASDERTAGPT